MFLDCLGFNVDPVISFPYRNKSCVIYCRYVCAIDYEISLPALHDFSKSLKTAVLKTAKDDSACTIAADTATIQKCIPSSAKASKSVGINISILIERLKHTKLLYHRASLSIALHQVVGE